MPENYSEANALADVMDHARDLTRFYLKALKGTDMFQEFEVNGQKLNSAYWIAAHTCWSENTLLLQCLSGPAQDIPWLAEFGIGKSLPADRSHLPSVKEVMQALKTVHEAALAHVRSLDAAALAEDNTAGVAFGGDKSKRMVIHHVIRHEAYHTGQLGWICKMKGIEMV